MEFRQHPVSRGLTVVEVLVVIGVLGLLATFASTTLVRSRDRASNRAVAETALEFIQETQHLAVSAEGGTAWGVRCAGNRLERFAFTGTAGPVVASEQFAGAAQCNPGTELTFQKLTGAPSAELDLTLSVHSAAAARIEIRQPGTLSLAIL